MAQRMLPLTTRVLYCRLKKCRSEASCTLCTILCKPIEKLTILLESNPMMIVSFQYGTNKALQCNMNPGNLCGDQIRISTDLNWFCLLGLGGSGSRTPKCAPRKKKYNIVFKDLKANFNVALGTNDNMLGQTKCWVFSPVKFSNFSMHRLASKPIRIQNTDLFGREGKVVAFSTN